ncbi:MAG: DUF4011 domain-containing protein, partial [Anaerolineales bacterium]|nr:DUF4011 domain-containing protein [Anaerolineales bacterium]
TLGMLNWFDVGHSEERRLAPLLLIPVELERTNVMSQFNLSYTEEEIVSNLPLAEKLRESGVELPQPDEELAINAYFAAVAAAIQYKPRWQVDRQALAISLFSYSTYLMYHDLNPAAWPDDQAISEHPTISRLLGQQVLAQLPSPFNEETFIDDHVDPVTSHQVLDADSSQTLALLDVNAGHDLIVSGPPGCGKSQTIANMIAEALGQDKTVLFVAEKQAALSVVKKRLDELGLGGACLELHSHKANKKAMLDELQETLFKERPAPPHAAHNTAQLRAERDRLNNYARAVNTPILNSAIRPYDIFGKLDSLRQRLPEQDRPRLQLPELLHWDEARFADAQRATEDLAAAIRQFGLPTQHPFWGTNLNFVGSQDLEAIRHAGHSCLQLGQALLKYSGALADELHLPRPDDLNGIKRLVDSARIIASGPTLQGIAVGERYWHEAPEIIQTALESWQKWTDIRARLEPWLLPAAWELPPATIMKIRNTISAKGDSRWRGLSGSYRAAENQLQSLCRQPLPATTKERLTLLDDLLAAARLRPDMERQDRILQQLFTTHWRREQSDWQKLTELTTWLAAQLQATAQADLPHQLLDYLAGQPKQGTVGQYASKLQQQATDYMEQATALVARLALDEARSFGPAGGLLYLPLSQQLRRLQRWYERSADLNGIVTLNQLTHELIQRGLGPLAAVAQSWPGAGNHLADLLVYIRYETLLDYARRQWPILDQFARNIHDESIQRFQSLDRLQLEINRAELQQKHWTSLPRNGTGGQIGVLQYEFEKKRRHKPIRRLMSEAGLAIQRIKPVFMMSPMSIANFLPPGAIEFDLVVFDEASQIRPVEAYGAIARGKQVIVVGDPKQLPPTSFFKQINEEDENDDSTANLESILGAFRASGVPERLLRWHYRR